MISVICYSNYVVLIHGLTENFVNTPKTRDGNLNRKDKIKSYIEVTCSVQTDYQGKND